MKRMTIIGDVRQDADLKINHAGGQFAIFTVGVLSANKINRRPDWVEVFCNGRLAEIASTHVKRGCRILVDGYPSVRAYINRDNSPIAVLRLSADSFEILGNKGGDEVIMMTSSVMGEDNTTTDAPF